MKITSLLAALLCMASLAACEKTTVNPAPTVITPTVEVPVAVPGPAVAVPGPAGPAGPEGKQGEAGESTTTVIVPEKTQ